jgi:hypothetical protein
MATTNFIQSFRTAAGRAAHPHLEPINAATFQSDHALALSKASNLIAYQKYLAAARGVKAQRKSVSLAFERNVQAQASNALDDLQTLCGGALRLTQQVNHTDFWSQSLTRMASALGSSGPVTAKQIWAEVQEGLQNPQYKSALEAAGLTDDVTGALTQIVSQLDASLVLRDGHVGRNASRWREPAPTPSAHIFSRKSIKHRRTVGRLAVRSSGFRLQQWRSCLH